METCQKILKAVEALSCDPNKITVLQCAELLAGKKIINIQNKYNFDISKYHNVITCSLSDITRLFGKMIIEDYLYEEIIFISEVPRLYVRVGLRTLIASKTPLE